MRSKHRFLFDKAALIRDATAMCAKHPEDNAERLYLKGLCDGLHGTKDAAGAKAIHVARQVIIATKED